MRSSVRAPAAAARGRNGARSRPAGVVGSWGSLNRTKQRKGLSAWRRIHSMAIQASDPAGFVSLELDCEVVVRGKAVGRFLPKHGCPSAMVDQVKRGLLGDHSIHRA